MYTLVCVGFFMLTIKDFFTLLLSCKEKNPFDSRANMGGSRIISGPKKIAFKIWPITYLPRVGFEISQYSILGTDLRLTRTSSKFQSKSISHQNIALNKVSS